MLLAGSPPICRSLEDLKQLGGDWTAAEGLSHTLGPVSADGCHNFDRKYQARRQREIDGRASERFFNPSKRAIARIQGDRAGDEELRESVRPGGRARCEQKARAARLSAFPGNPRRPHNPPSPSSFFPARERSGRLTRSR